MLQIENKEDPYTEQKNLNNFMSRKRKAPVRKVYPDPKFGSEVISKFVNSIMLDGKRSTAEKILYDALDKIKSKGVNVVSITLDIGIGTFMPIKENDITKHKMHSEKIYLSSLGAQTIDDALKSEARIFCVGTTSLRCLESIFNKFEPK